MSLGWSAGDIVSSISTLVKVGRAIKETGGAANEYQEALSFLVSVEATLRGLETISASNPDLTLNDELVEQARLLKSAVDDFRKKVDKYDLSLGADSDRRKVRRIPREVQFALSETIKELRAAIIQPQLVLDICINLQTLSSILELSQSNALSQDSVRTLITQMSYVIPIITDSLATMKQSIEMQSMQSTATSQGLRQGQENIAQSIEEFSTSINNRLETLLHKDSEPQNPGIILPHVITSAVQFVATGIASAMGTLAAVRFYAPKSHQQDEGPSSDLVRCAPNSSVPARSPSVDTTCKETLAIAARCLRYNLEEVSTNRQYRAGSPGKTNQVADPGSYIESDGDVHDPQTIPSSVVHFDPDLPINAPESLATMQTCTFTLQAQDLRGVDDEPQKPKHHWKKLPMEQSSAISSSTKAPSTEVSSLGWSSTRTGLFSSKKSLGCILEKNAIEND
ncbi:hypothetical protein V491_01039 [Pseudogymnoascus sp. VKM F-3775]|nr:hypothetical protein V491_01039 [Pseudogymnoascus sp. VKM F-3775]